MLEALCLLKDLKKLSYSAEKNMAELCQLVAKLGVHASKAYGDTLSMMNDHTEALTKKKEAEKSLKEAKAELRKHKNFVEEAAEGLKERDKLRVYLKEFKVERERLEKEKKEAEKQLEAKLKEAADQGWDEASKEIKKQLLLMLAEKESMGMLKGELKGIQETHRVFVLQGFQAGLDAAQILADHSLREFAEVLEVILPSHLLPLLKPKSPSIAEEEEKPVDKVEEQPPSFQEQSAEETPSVEKTVEESEQMAI